MIRQHKKEPWKERQGAECDAICQHVIQVVSVRARRWGLSGEASEDCALEFVERMLLHDDWRPLHPAQASASSGSESGSRQYRVSEAWLRRCADNFVHNVRRRWERISRNEQPWPQWSALESIEAPGELPSQSESPEQALLRGEFEQRLYASVRQLTPAQQELFERHFLGDETVADLAATTGRSAHAVSQALLTIRKRLRGLLERQGIDELAAREYLHAQEPSYEYLPFPLPRYRE